MKFLKTPSKARDILFSISESNYGFTGVCLSEKLDRLASRYPSIALHISMNKIYIGFNEPTNNAFDTKSMLTNISYDQEVKKIEKDINDIKYIISMIRELHANSGNVPQGAPADNTINQSGFGYMDPEYDSNNYYQSL